MGNSIETAGRHRDGRIERKFGLVGAILSAIGVLTFPLEIASPAQSLDDLSATVCSLSDQKTVTESVDGKDFEVWLREPNSTNYHPKFSTIKGTGFFVRGTKLGYLVTARHMAQNLSPGCIITVASATGTQSVPIPFGALRGNMPIPWIHHPQADVSILPFWLTPEYISRFLSRHLLDLSALVAETNSPSRDVELTTLGFPFGLGVEAETFSPISKVSKASSGLLRNEQGVRYFMLQDPSIDGFSGSPVLIVPGLGFTANGIAPKGPLKCVGLISATRSDSSGGKMAIVIPSFYALQLINELESVLTFTSNAPKHENTNASGR